MEYVYGITITSATGQSQTVEPGALSHLATFCALVLFKVWEALRHERAVARPNTAAADMADQGMRATTQGLGAQVTQEV